MTSLHAVITNDRILIASPGRKVSGVRLLHTPNHITDLWHIGQMKSVTHFWIMPGSSMDDAGYDFLAPRENFDIFVPLANRPNRPDKPRAARIRAKIGHEVIISYPGRDPFGWSIKHPLDILASIAYLSELLEVDIQWSPQSIGEAILKRQYPNSSPYLASPRLNLADIPFRQSAPELLGFMPFSPQQSGMIYHQYDKNSAHPSAARSINTGYGEPIHLTGEVTEKHPGIYRVLASPPSGYRLPLVIESEWITLDVLRYARREEYRVTVLEAYVFEQSTRLFDQWVTFLWQARQAIKDTGVYSYAPGRENAANTIKDIMNRTISSLRANWWADMVGAARVARLANIRKFYQDSGLLPHLMYADDLGYVSPEPRPGEAIPHILDRSSKLGGYKHKFSIQLTPELIAECNRLATPGQVLSYLRKIAQDRGVTIG